MEKGIFEKSGKVKGQKGVAVRGKQERGAGVKAGGCAQGDTRLKIRVRTRSTQLRN